MNLSKSGDAILVDLVRVGALISKIQLDADEVGKLVGAPWNLPLNKLSFPLKDIHVFHVTIQTN